MWGGAECVYVCMCACVCECVRGGRVLQPRGVLEGGRLLFVAFKWPFDGRVLSTKVGEGGGGRIGSKFEVYARRLYVSMYGVVLVVMAVMVMVV